MTTEIDREGSPLPKPRIEKQRRLSPALVWLVPLVAAIVGLSIVVRTIREQGPTITIVFQTADGIEPGKTEVKYKNVLVGRVGTVTLDRETHKVEVAVDLEKKYSYFAVDDTRFWVERPRIGLGGVSGLGTLLSGAYIGVDVGVSKKGRKHFLGDENPPSVTRDVPGRRFYLHGKDLGSLDIGSPVYFHRVAVGRIVSWHLDDDGRGVTLEMFISTPYDAHVTSEKRFYNASGVDLSVTSAGLKVNTQSLSTIVAGGVAFDSPPGEGEQSRAKDGTTFSLFPNLEAALMPPDGPSMAVRIRFNESVRGLSLGAPLNFRGVDLGSVTAINMKYDNATKSFPIDVDALIFPARLGEAYQDIVAARGPSHEDHPGIFFRALIEHGFRAQLRSGNLITGQLYIALDFMKNAPKVEYDISAKPLAIPSVPGPTQEIQDEIADIARKLDRIPFDKIGQDLHGTLTNANLLLAQLNTQIAPQAKATLQSAQGALDSLNAMLTTDSPTQRNARQTMEELQRAARSLRNLADYLDRHPEALLRGKPDEAETTRGKKGDAQ